MGITSSLWAADPTLTLTPSPVSLSFSYQTGTALPAPQTLAVKAGSSTAVYSVALTNPDPPAQPLLWLTATPDTGKLPASLSVRVNPTGMPAGTYRGSITVSGTGVGTASVPVTLTVSQPLATLTVSRNTIAISAPPLTGSAVATLSTTSGPVSFNASISGATWLSLSPASGYVLPGAPVTLTLAVDATALSPQAAPYVAKVTIAATGASAASKSQTITVNLTVNSTAAAVTPPIWPSSVRAGAPATTVTIRGTNFYSGTTIKISPQGGSGPATTVSPTVLDSMTLMGVIPASLLNAAQTLKIVASNPAGDSTPVPFVVSANPVVQAAVNLASYALSPVSPGELITLFGAGIGPSKPVLMADADGDGFVDTSNGGVSVTIDGKDAPILYAAQDQISVQVPYDAKAGSDKAISVSNGGVVAQGAVTIAPTAPAIFTLNGSGSGQAAALNYNAATRTYALNTSATPAKPGDVVLLYITGEGDYASASVPQRTGYLVPANLSPLPQLSALPAVTIGGASATVQYAGPMVNSILGIMQLNVVVPATATTGVAVPISVSVGGVSAQTGVTLTIHQ